MNGGFWVVRGVALPDRNSWLERRAQLSLGTPSSKERPADIEVKASGIKVFCPKEKPE